MNDNHKKMKSVNVGAYAKYATALYDAGFRHIIPVDGKRPVESGWQNSNDSREVIEKKSNNGLGRMNIGLCFGKGKTPLIGIDIDITDKIVSEKILESFWQRFGKDGFPVRIGKAPKLMIIAATDREFTKKKLNCGQYGAIELLGKGQQGVIKGVHPDTRMNYKYQDAEEFSIDKIELWQIGRIELPHIVEWMNQLSESIKELSDVVNNTVQLHSTPINSIQHQLFDFNEELEELENLEDLDLSVTGSTNEGVGSTESSGRSSEGDVNIFDLEDFSDQIGYGQFTTDEIKKVLSRIDNNIENNEWVKVGQALQHWDPIEGLKLWEQWSIGGETYKAGETAKRWKSFNIDHGITIGTLFHFAGVSAKKLLKARDKNKSDKKKANKVQHQVTLLKDRIKRANITELKQDVCPDIAITVNIDAIDREALALAIQSRLKDLDGTKYSIAAVRKMITPVRGNIVDKEAWYKEWLFVVQHDKFFNLSERQEYGTQGFNIKCGQYVPYSEQGGKQTAVRFVSDNGLLKTISQAMYLPGCDDLVCYYNNKEVLNTFNSDSIPDQSANMNDKGKAYIKLIYEHFKHLLGSSEYAKLLINYIAHVRQHPGKIIGWAPLIQSAHGLGKTFIHELVKVVLGITNVQDVSANAIMSTFNDWAQGALMNVCEEILISGHNRYDALNAVKSCITNQQAAINGKGIRVLTVPNKTNYIFLTNYRNALPLDSTERRFCVLFSPISSAEEFAETLSVSLEQYFTELYDGLSTYCEQICHFFANHKIPDSFYKQKVAPRTVSFDMMLATEKSGTEGLLEIEQLLKKGGHLYCKDAISSTDLFHDLEEKYEIMISNNSKNALLKKLGYSQMPNPIKIENKNRRIWVKKHLSNNEIRKLLES